MSDSEGDISFEEPPVYYEQYPRTEKVTCRFGKKIQWTHGHFSKKSILIAEGTPLPATFPFGMGQFNIIVDRDLSISFNGTRLADGLVSRVPDNGLLCGSSGTFFSSTPVRSAPAHDASSFMAQSTSTTLVDLQLASGPIPSVAVLNTSVVETSAGTVLTLDPDQAALLQHHFQVSAEQQPADALPTVDQAEQQPVDAPSPVNLAEQQPVDAVPTVNFLLNLNSQFKTLVVDNLEAKIKETIVKKEDISARTPLEQKRIRNAVLHQVYGKSCFHYIFQNITRNLRSVPRNFCIFIRYRTFYLDKFFLYTFILFSLFSFHLFPIFPHEFRYGTECLLNTLCINMDLLG
jgi:hypothetical protein